MSPFRAPPMPGHRYVEEISSTAMLATKRLAGVAPEVNLMEYVTCMPLPSMNKPAYSGFKTQRRHHQKSKTGVSEAPQKGLMSSKIFFKKLLINLLVWTTLNPCMDPLFCEAYANRFFCLSFSSFLQKTPAP